MEDWQKRHITLAQLTLTNMIATKIWLIGEIENKSNLTHEEKGDYVSNYSRQIKLTILIFVVQLSTKVLFVFYR